MQSEPAARDGGMTGSDVIALALSIVSSTRPAAAGLCPLRPHGVPGLFLAAGASAAALWVLLACAALTAVFAPLTMDLYRNKN